tara:strand:- start:308 stop:736 length:429 start_codon:yes stop_codon:yes gene_type:complete
MARNNDVKNIKQRIDEILGAKSSLREKLPSKQNHIKTLFCDILKNLQFVNSRTLGMKHDYKVDMIEYDDPFYIVVENLIKIHFNHQQQSIINWWLYDKFLPTGDILVLTDSKTDEIIPSDTPEDVWDLVNDLNKKDEEKDPN